MPPFLRQLNQESASDPEIATGRPLYWSFPAHAALAFDPPNSFHRVQQVGLVHEFVLISPAIALLCLYVFTSALVNLGVGPRSYSHRDDAGRR